MKLTTVPSVMESPREGTGMGLTSEKYLTCVNEERTGAIMLQKTPDMDYGMNE